MFAIKFDQQKDPVSGISFLLQFCLSCEMEPITDHTFSLKLC